MTNGICVLVVCVLDSVILVGSVSATPAPPLAWHLQGVVAEADLRDIEALTAHTEAQGNRQHVHRVRNFGAESIREHEGGHRMSFLHAAAEAKLFDLLWRLTEQAAVAAGWWSEVAKPWARPAVRCIEAIEYFGATGHGSAGHSLGWHTDGCSLLTTAVALSTPEDDFTGGDFEIQRGTPGSNQTGHSILQPRRGDAMVWQGWHMHRVQPIFSGVRRVLVVEWWAGEEPSEKSPRKADTEAACREALRRDPRSAILHNEVGGFLRTGGQMEEAADYFQKALDIDPSYAGAHFNLATVYELLGRPADAEVEYTRAVAIDPSNVGALKRLTKLRLAADDPAGALVHAHRAVNSAPSDLTLWRDLGQIQLSLGLARQAHTSFQAALERSPDGSMAYAMLVELVEEAAGSITSQAPEQWELVDDARTTVASDGSVSVLV